MDETTRLIEAGAAGAKRPPPAAEPPRLVRTRGAAPGPGAPRRERVMDETTHLIEAGAAPAHREQPAMDPLRQMKTRDLVTELARKASLLARKEVELAKVELKADIRSEVRMASGLGVAGLCALFTVQLLLTAVVFALFESRALPGWLASLVVAAVVLAIGTGVGLWGWARRVRKPLDSTRRSLQEDVRWAKERIV